MDNENTRMVNYIRSDAYGRRDLKYHENRARFAFSVNCKLICGLKRSLLRVYTARIDDIFTKGITEARKKQNSSLSAVGSLIDVNVYGSLASVKMRYRP